jgi:hypothetical protein
MKSLSELYKDPKIGYTSVNRFYSNLKKSGYDYTLKDVKEFLNKNPTNQIHSEEKRVFLPIETSNIKQQYQIDLLVLIKSKAKTYDVIDNIKKTDLRYVLCLIDVYSRKADCRFIKNKTPELTLKALKEMIEDMGKPIQISADKGKEWLGVFRKYCKDNDIELTLKDKDAKYSTSIIERFNRTLIGYIKRYKTENPKKGINQIAANLPDFIEQYNNSYHRNIKTSPQNAWDDNFTDENRYLSKKQFAKTQFQVGDTVRVRLTRTVYTKGRTAIFSKQKFKIVGKESNSYTLDKEFEGRTEFAYNSLVKVDDDE